MKDEKKLLQEIYSSVSEINNRQSTNDFMKEGDDLIKKAEARSEYSLNQIQNSFDRIHDKLFNLNNVLIGAFLVLGTFPNNNPILDLWWVSLPIFNLIFLLYIEKKQLNIYRHASQEMSWDDVERKKYGKMITKQNLVSLFSIIITISIVLTLVINVIIYKLI